MCVHTNKAGRRPRTKQDFAEFDIIKQDMLAMLAESEVHPDEGIRNAAAATREAFWIAARLRAGRQTMIHASMLERLAVVASFGVVFLQNLPEEERPK